MSEVTYIEDDECDLYIYQCNNCGAYAPGIELIIHHKGCKLGEAKHWEEFYERANEEETGEW